MTTDSDITFDCGQCGQRLVVDAAGAGSAMECPTCRTTITVPATREATLHPWEAPTAHADEVADAHPSLPAPDLVAQESGQDHSAVASLPVPGAEEPPQTADPHEQVRQLTLERERLSEIAMQLHAEARQSQTERQNLKAELTTFQQRLAETVAESTRATGKAEDAAALAAETGARLSEVSAVRDHLARELARVTEELHALQAEHHSACERIALADLRLSATEAQLGTREEEAKELGQTTAILQSEVRELRQHVEARDRAIATHQQHIEALTVELADARRWEAHATGLAAEVQARDAAVAAQVARAAALDAALTAEKARVAAAQAQADQLRKDLLSSKEGREFAALRDGAAQAGADRERTAQELEHVRRDLKETTHAEQSLRAELASVRTRLESAEQRALALSESQLHHDNDVLRGILERQKGELEQRYKELLRFRRARLGTRLAYALFACALLGVIALAVWLLPAVMEMVMPVATPAK